MMLPQRKSARLKGYDYTTPGAYFVTVCTKDKQCFFGKVVGGTALQIPQVKLSKAGQIAVFEIQNLEAHYENVKIDAFIVMPNHIHLLIRITERIHPLPTPKRYNVPCVVGRLKAAITRGVGKAFMPSASGTLWQTSFHDHIVRNEKEYAAFFSYIQNNPSKWNEDKFYIP